MKRHGFSGQKASHGAHRIHRAPGAIGSCATPVPGVQGPAHGRAHGWREGHHPEPQLVARADAERGLLLVKGAVPGPKGGLVLVRNAVKATAGRCGLMATVDVLDAKGKKPARPTSTTPSSASSPTCRSCTRSSPPSSPPAGPGPRAPRPAPRSRGGGAKPWKQKGTGRARQGSIRSPQWRGGGVALGPKPRSYAQRTPKKMIRLALRSALSDRAADGKVLVVDWGMDAPKTERGRRRAGRARRRGPGRWSCCRPRTTRPGRASATSSDVHIVEARELNAYDVLVADWVVFTHGTLPADAPAARRRGRESARRSSCRRREPDRRSRLEERLRRSDERAMSVTPARSSCKPVVSEKSYGLLETNVYTFVVHPDASKPEIQRRRRVDLRRDRHSR